MRIDSSKLRSYLVLALAACLALALALPAAAERGDDSQRLSKNGKTTGTIDGVEVTIEYGRPKVKEREVWGGLVPMGKVWRSGADEATTITFSAPVKIEGEALPAGTYSLFTVPGEKDWQVVFNTVAEQWGAYDYDSSKDALRVTVTPKAVEHVEELDFVIEGDAIHLRWDGLAVPFKVSAGE